MKKLFAIVFLLVLALGYVACGGNSSPTGPTAPNLPANVTPSPGVTPMPTPTPY
jgi:hypothetical protein